MGKINDYIKALKKNGDGRYHYYDGKAKGIGCSEYTRICLEEAGIIKRGETFHAGSGNPGVLTDTSRFQKISWNPSNLKEGDILWSNGYHVATWDGENGVYEAAPEKTHGICDNGKTGVGHWSNHTYRNCGTGTNSWSWIYRIIDPSVNRIDAFVNALPVIQLGSKGEMTKILQQQLKEMGFYEGEIDGSAGTLTVTAIKAAQKSWGIGQDGKFGPKSWLKLLT